MAPRSQTLPQAATESAREARKSFFCEMCQKGYARQPEFEAHENSYDHQHRKRLKEMRNLTKDPAAAARARAAEDRNNAESGLKSISLSAAGVSTAGAVSGKKKPVFKSTLQPQNVPAPPKQEVSLPGLRPMEPKDHGPRNEGSRTMPNDEEYAAYLERLKEQMDLECGPDWWREPAPVGLEEFKKEIQWDERALIYEDLRPKD